MATETPDIETASADYASRFAGRAGDYMLGIQEECLRRASHEFAGGSLLDVGGGHGQLIELYKENGFDFKINGLGGRQFGHAG